MIAQAALPTDGVFFGGHLNPFPYDPAGLPGDQDDSRKDHQDGHPPAALGQGHDITEPHGGESGHGKVEGISKISYLGIGHVFCLKEQARRHEKDNQDGQQQT